MLKPVINVTPLIDVLLVLLIIFMVVAPLKPSSFHAKIPSESTGDERILNHPDVLVVSVERDLSLTLNGTRNLGTADGSEPLIAMLRKVFAERNANGNISSDFATDQGRPFSDAIERTVFIKAPRDLDYGSVAKVVDAAKIAGAYPISLQIDRLD